MGHGLADAVRTAYAKNKAKPKGTARGVRICRENGVALFKIPPAISGMELHDDKRLKVPKRSGFK
jgi:hypothetical protein